MSRTLARPYAQAVFELAQAENRLDQWEEFLTRLSGRLSEPGLARMLSHPRVDHAERVEIMKLAFGQVLRLEESNLIALLVQHDRLSEAADLLNQYRTLKMRAESVIECAVTTAVPLDDHGREIWITHLAARFKRKIRLICRTDPELLGGAELRVGDHVWDASIHGQIDQLSRLLAARL
ncbi:ATPase, F1 complex, OSCP/delta subunit [mine drainage metagenome]|uniref:ATPase, F1 complex, OSCP/delta subunit n=1 Tax=mine drainage metagenome TaxID=410659 RepID=T1C376_9ZZZZ